MLVGEVTESRDLKILQRLSAGHAYDEAETIDADIH
jgi:hypothetical protein